MPFSRVLAFLACLVVAPIAAAQPARLIFRWSPGEPVRYEITETMRQSITGPLTSDLNWKRTISYSERLIGETETGTRIERVFDRVTVSSTRDAEPPIRYDSEVPDPEAAKSILIAPFVGLAGTSIRFTVGDDGAVTDVEGAAETLDALFTPLESGALSTGLAGFRQTPGRKARIAKQIEQAMLLIPGETKQPGARWPVEIDHESPLAGNLTSDLSARFPRRDAKSGAAIITLDGALVLTPPEPGTLDLMSLAGITLDSGKITGRILFDDDAGRIDTSTMELKTAWTVGSALTVSDDAMRQIIDQKAELKRLR